MTTPPPGPPRQVSVRFPEAIAKGDYANGINVGINAHEIVLDLFVNVDAPGVPPTVELVRRIRLPIAMAQDLLAGVGAAMDAYERVFGDIHRPQPKMPPAEPNGLS